MSESHINKTARIGAREIRIPGDWDTVELRDLIEVSGSGEWGEETKSDDTNKQALVLRSGDITLDGELSTKDIATRFLSERDYSRYAINPLDIVIVSSSGSERHIGKKWLAPETLAENKYHYTNFLYRIRLDDDECCPRFIYYFLSSDFERTFLESITPTSTGLQNLDTDSYEDLTIPFPSLAEQHCIADILSTADEQIQQTDEIIEKTKELLSGVQQKLFTEGYYDGRETGTRRLIEAPVDWDVAPLSEFTIDSAYGPRFSSDEYDEGGDLATLRTTDLTDDGDISHETMPLADLDPDDFAAHILEEGDFVISRTGAYCGICTVWDGYDIPTVPGAYMIRFRLTEELNPLFLRYYINSSIGSKKVDVLARGSSQKNLAGSDLLSMPIPVPNREEQDLIVEIIQTVKERIGTERKYKQRLQELRRGLMQDLLTGEVRVNPDN